MLGDVGETARIQKHLSLKWGRGVFGLGGIDKRHCTLLPAYPSRRWARAGSEEVKIKASSGELLSTAVHCEDVLAKMFRKQHGHCITNL